MSRDWTPAETYAVEQWNIQRGNGSLWDFMRNSKWIIDGVEAPCCTEEQIVKRQEFPLLGRLFEKYDKLYEMASKRNGGLKVLACYERALDAYIQTGQGDRESDLIKWFNGELDPGFYYREHNDRLLFELVSSELAALEHSDPHHGRCVWFALSKDKCISVWYDEDRYDGDQLLMKLEERGEDGSMGPHCETICDESYGTENLKAASIRRCLREVYADAGLEDMADSASQKLTEEIMEAFELKKLSLDNQIQNASTQANSANTSGPQKNSPDR